MKYWKIPLFCCIVSLPSLLAGQVATVSNPPAPREAGIGFAGAALGGGISSVWFNPAGLADLAKMDAFLSYQKPFNLPFFSNFAAGATYGSSKFGTFGLTAESFAVTYQGVDLSSEWTVGISHAFYLQKDLHSSLAVGYTARFLYWDLGESVEGIGLGSDGAVGIDLGVQGSLWGRTRAGGAIRNLNAPVMGEITKHQLPRMVLLGMTYEPYHGVITALGAEKVLGGEMRLQGGIELEAAKSLRLRAGAFTEPNSFTLGFGLKHGPLGFDYAYVSHPTLEGSHLFGLRYSP